MTSYDRPYQGFPYTNPTVIDVPTIERNDQWTNLPRKPINPPKVTIPKNTEVQRNQDGDTPEYVRDTILYNPFEDSRININDQTEQQRPSHPENDKDSSASSSSSISEEDTPRIYIPPGPRDELNGEGSSVPNISNRNPHIPTFMNKEASIYQSSNDDGFPLSPIPVSEFPEPPPAYSEIDRIGTNNQNRTLEPNPVMVVEQPPRTQVILPTRGK